MELLPSQEVGAGCLRIALVEREGKVRHHEPRITRGGGALDTLIGHTHQFETLIRKEEYFAGLALVLEAKLILSSR